MSRKANRKSQKLSPLCKMAEYLPSISNPLKFSYRNDGCPGENHSNFTTKTHAEGTRQSRPADFDGTLRLVICPENRLPNICT